MKPSRFEIWIEKNTIHITFASIFLYAFFVILTFDAKVSVGGDDSGYIIAAKEFIEGVAFPSWHGSFYPIFLSPFIAIWGINIILLKFISVLLVAAQIYLLGVVLKNKIPSLIWAFTIFLAAINTQNIIYAGTTYSEALFLFLQALVLFFFFKVDSLDLKNDEKKKTFFQFLLLGLSIFLLALTRNIGYGALLAIITYFIIRGEYLKSLFSVAGFFLFQIPFGIYKRIVWGIKDAGFESQLNSIAYKEFYQPNKGTEDFWGFVQRFWDNSELYLSKHLMKFLGFVKLDSIHTSTILTIVIYLIFIALTIYFFRNRKQMLFIGFYLAILIGGTFITQQKSWDQERLILIFLPLICIYLGTGVYLFFSDKNAVLNKILMVFLVLILILNVKNNFNRINIIQVQKNLKGDKFYGYTSDWENYLKICRWAGKNISNEHVIACRKPSMAEIYGNRKFHGIYKVPTQDSDEMKAYFEKNSIDYIIVGSLRINPKINTGRVITTVRNSLKVLLNKYPYALELIKYEGKSEYAMLFKVYITPENLTEDVMIKRLESGLMVFPENYNAQYALSMYYARKKEYNKALERVNFIINTQKNNIQLITHRAGIYFAMKNYKNASVDYEFVVKNQPQNAEGWFNLGLCYYNMQNPNYKFYLQKAKSMGVVIPKNLL